MPFKRRRRGLRRKRGRVGRKRRFRKGAGRRVIMANGLPSARMGRLGRHPYRPPMGKLRMSLSHYQSSMKFKVSFVDKFQFTQQMATPRIPDADGHLHIVQTLSQCIYTAGGGTIPSANGYACQTGWQSLCPDFYRAIAGWKSFTFTGMSMDIYALPQFLTSSFNATTDVRVDAIRCPEQAYSVVESDQNIDRQVLQTALSPHPSYKGVTWERVCLIAGAKTAGLDFAVRSDVVPRNFRPRRFFHRYTKCFRFTTLQRENNASKWYQDVNGAYSGPPNIAMQQPEMWINYVIPMGLFLGPNPSGTGNLNLEWRVKRTYYGRMKDRMPETTADYWSYSVPYCEEQQDTVADTEALHGEPDPSTILAVCDSSRKCPATGLEGCLEPATCCSPPLECVLPI